MEAVEETMSAAESIELGAVDNEFYCKHFFPKAFRQDSPEFHTHAWEDMEYGGRYVGLMIFRDGAKTTIARAFLSKRIAYATSRTIVVVGKSEDAACKTLDWLRRAVLHNSKWAETYGLSPGETFNASHLIVKHKTMGCDIQVIALGIHGSVRGINLDDYRPDLILVDDPCDEENTATADARKKISDLFFGGLKNTLAPATDMPEARMILLQTPLQADDLINQVARDPEWKCVRYSIFDEHGRSRWEARWPTATILKDKAGYIDRNQLSLWLREKEVTVISPESSWFKESWLDYWDVLPEGGVIYIGIDPTPPPKDQAQIIKNPKLDDAVILAIKVHRGVIYLIDYWLSKSPLSEEIVHQFFVYRNRFKPFKVGVETFLFQRTLKVDLEKEMSRKQEFTTITAVEDKRPKPVRIAQTVSDYASHRKIKCHKRMSEFIEQFTTYPQSAHDDILDALSIAIMQIVPGLDSAIEGEFTVVNEEDPETQKLLLNWRR